MKVFHKADVDLNPRDEWNFGIKNTYYGAHIEIQTDDEGLLNAVLDALVQIEEKLRGDNRTSRNSD